MKIEELTPLKELAFNYVKNTLKRDIKLEDIYILLQVMYMGYAFALIFIWKSPTFSLNLRI